MKKPDNLIREYVRRISEEDLRFLNIRCQNPAVPGHRYEIIEVLSKDKEVDKLLGTAADATEFFSLLEQLCESVVRESKNRRKPSTTASRAR